MLIFSPVLLPIFMHVLKFYIFLETTRSQCYWNKTIMLLLEVCLFQTKKICNKQRRSQWGKKKHNSNFCRNHLIWMFCYMKFYFFQIVFVPWNKCFFKMPKDDLIFNKKISFLLMTFIWFLRIFSGLIKPLEVRESEKK